MSNKGFLGCFLSVGFGVLFYVLFTSAYYITGSLVWGGAAALAISMLVFFGVTLMLGKK